MPRSARGGKARSSVIVPSRNTSIASGGIASLGDIEALAAAAEDGIEGAIIGRALYDGRIEPRAALSLVNDRRTESGPQGTSRC